MDMKDEMGLAMDRLEAAAGLLEQVAERLGQHQTALAENTQATIGRIVATVEARREVELEEKLAQAEAKIVELQAHAATAGSGRKTLPATGFSSFAKHGTLVDSLEASALDAALVSLSLEQRIAVKAQLMRAGLIG